MVGLTLRRWATRPSVAISLLPFHRTACHFAPPAESQRVGFALTRLCQLQMRQAATRRNWHEGVLPVRHTTHIVRSVVPPTLILFAPTLPASGTLRRGIKVRQCAVVCQPAASLSRCVLPDPRARSAHCRPVRHAPRQFAGILHANSAAPPLMQPGELARSARSEKQRRLAVA